MAAGSNAVKIVLMGQGGVGKTAMVMRFTTGEFMEGYLPTIGDMYTADIEVTGAPRHLEIDDTAGQEAYADLKNEKLGTGDGYLLVFAITDDSSFAKLDRVRDEIIKAQLARGRRVPIFLVGTKADLASERSVSEKEAKAKAKAWDSKYFECSAKTSTNIEPIFVELVREVLSTTTDPTKGGGGGSVFAGGAAPKVETVKPAETKRSRCSIL